MPSITKHLGPTVSAHLILSALCLLLIWLTDYVERSEWWPAVGCVVFLAFDYLQRQTLIAAAEFSYFSHRLKTLGPAVSNHLFLIGALGTSWILMTFLLWAWSLPAGLSAHTFMYAATSYSFGIPLPVLILATHSLRVASLRVRLTTGIVNSPVLHSLPYFLTFVLLLPTAGTAYLTHSNQLFANALRLALQSPVSTRIADDAWLSSTREALRHRYVFTRSATVPRDERIAAIAAVKTRADLLLAQQWLYRDFAREVATRVARRWRNLLILACGGIAILFYMGFARLSSYTRRPETVLATLLVPIAMLWLASSTAATILTVGFAAAITEPALITVAQSTLHSPLSMDSVLIGWITAIPVALVVSPLLITTLNDPFKSRSLSREQQRMSGLPFLNRMAPRLLASTSRTVAYFWTRVVRSQIVAIAIWRKNVTALVFSLPLSLLATARAIGQPLDYVLLTATISGSLVWLGVLVNGLYFFVDTCSSAFESGLVGHIRGLNKHAIIAGYDDLGRAMLKEWITRQLVGYADTYDHLLAGPNVVLPNGGLGRLLLKVLVIDEPLASGVGLVSLQRNVSGSVVAAGPFLDSRRADTAVINRGRKEGPPSTALRGFTLRTAVEAFDKEQAQLVEFYVPMVAGNLSSAEVRRAASIRRSRFIVSTAWRQKDAANGFVALESIASLASSGVIVPVAALTGSSAFTPHIAVRTSLSPGSGAAPAHVIQVDRLEASEAAARLWAAIERLRREQGGASALIVASGRRLFHLIDGLLTYLDESVCESFGTQFGRGANHIAILADDAVLDDLPRFTPSGNWSNVVAPLEQAHLKCHLLCYQPHVTRLHPQGESSGEISRSVAKGIWILHVKGDSRDHQTACLVDRLLAPGVVVVSEPVVADALRRLNSIGTAVARRKSRTPAQLIVTADRSRRELSRLYDNSLVYSAALSRQLGDGFYPQAREGYVDPMRDAAEQVSGLLAAYSRVERRNESDVVELSVCSLNGPGGIASTLARLCGGKVAAPANFMPTGLSLSLVDMRLDIKDGRRFVLRAFGRLKALEPYSKSSWPGCRATIAAPASTNPERTMRHVWRVLGVQPHAPKDLIEKTSTARASCCGMANCSIEATQKLVVSADAVNDSLLPLSYRYWGADNGRDVWKSLRRLDSTCDEDAIAAIELDCTLAESRGSFAVAVGALLGWCVTVDAGTAHDVVHVTHMSGLKCHDRRFGLYSLYGFTQTSECRPIPTVCDVVNRVTIRPVCNNGKRWEGYEGALRGFFEQEATKCGAPAPIVQLLHAPPSRQGR